MNSFQKFFQSWQDNIGDREPRFGIASFPFAAKAQAAALACLEALGPHAPDGLGRRPGRCRCAHGTSVSSRFASHNASSLRRCNDEK